MCGRVFVFEIHYQNALSFDIVPSFIRNMGSNEKEEWREER
jgi:hypothetical protein